MIIIIELKYVQSTIHPAGAAATSMLQLLISSYARRVDWVSAITKVLCGLLSVIGMRAIFFSPCKKESERLRLINDYMYDTVLRSRRSSANRVCTCAQRALVRAAYIVYFDFHFRGLCYQLSCFHIFVFDKKIY